jgi:hypothetical protein
VCRAVLVPRFRTEDFTTHLAAPLNFLIFPKFGRFDEAHMRERINYPDPHNRLNSSVSSRIDGGVEAFVAWIRERHANGV